MVLPQQMHVASIRKVGTSHRCSKPFTEPTRSGSRLQGVSQSYLCLSLLNVHVTFDLLEIEKTLPRGSREDAALRIQQQGSNSCFGQSSPVQSSPVHSPVQSRVQVLQRPDRSLSPRFKPTPAQITFNIACGDSLGRTRLVR